MEDPEDYLSLALNLYRIEFKHVQSSVITTAGIGAYTNLGDAHTNGIDLEAHWRTPLEGLSVGGIANVNDSKFDSVDPAIRALADRTPGSGVVWRIAL